MPLAFSESEIQRLFGHEAAEDEDINRLRTYYVKSSTYEQVVNELPLRILVGHKGIGKSALFQVAMAEDEEAGNLSLLIRPDDVADLGTDTSDFLKTIRNWKEGLLQIIARKVLTSFGMGQDELSNRLKNFGGKLLDFLYETFRSHTPANLTPARQAVLERFLNSSIIIVYIDDLDRGWQGRREDVVRISALLNAVRDIINDTQGIRFRIGLRSDVYYLVRTSDESTDKVEGSVIWQAWTNHEIFVLLVKRIETFFNRDVNERELIEKKQKDLSIYLNHVMEHRFRGEGHWKRAPMYRVIMSLIRKRPRDLVKLCTLAARKAREHNHDLIYTEDLEAIFEEYSQGRIQDTINEFRSELPEIERLLLNMKPSKKERTAQEGYVYSTEKLLKKISNIMERGNFYFSDKKLATPKDLANFLYKINFITARKDTKTGVERKYFEENRYLTSKFADFGYDWEIHPAYRWALQPDNHDEIWSKL